MSFPTALNPWFVVQQLPCSTQDKRDIEYYTADDTGAGMFADDPKQALVFTSLHSAARVASSEGAQVRVLTTKEEADEFGRS